MVDALPSRGSRVAIEHRLNLSEDRGGRERLVSSRELLALVRHESEVVAVAKEPSELGLGHGSGRTSRSWARPQATPFKIGGELDQREVAGCEEFEGERHEVRAFGIDPDRADFVALELLAHVEVPELGGADAAAVLDLLAHLVANVGTVGIRPVLIESGEDAVHELAGGRLIDVLLGGDQGDAASA